LFRTSGKVFVHRHTDNRGTKIMPAHDGTKRIPTEPFGVRVPVPLLHRFEAMRIERGFRFRNDAIIAAMQEWIEQAEHKEAA
jgi:hypothetical protein